MDFAPSAPGFMPDLPGRQHPFPLKGRHHPFFPRGPADLFVFVTLDSRHVRCPFFLDAFPNYYSVTAILQSRIARKISSSLRRMARQFVWFTMASRLPGANLVAKDHEIRPFAVNRRRDQKPFQAESPSDPPHRLGNSLLAAFLDPLPTVRLPGGRGSLSGRGNVAVGQIQHLVQADLHSRGHERRGLRIGEPFAGSSPSIPSSPVQECSSSRPPRRRPSGSTGRP